MPREFFGASPALRSTGFRSDAVVGFGPGIGSFAVCTTDVDAVSAAATGTPASSSAIVSMPLGIGCPFARFDSNHFNVKNKVLAGKGMIAVQHRAALGQGNDVQLELPMAAARAELHAGLQVQVGRQVLAHRLEHQFRAMASVCLLGRQFDLSTIARHLPLELVLDTRNQLMSTYQKPIFVR